MKEKSTPKICFIGAGSLGFTRRLLADILTVPELQNYRVAFMDIDERNLEMVTELCQRDIDANEINIQIEATTDRQEALKDANYVICTVRIGGLKAFAHDVEIPLKYGVDQCVGDTLAPGGIFYAQRTIPFLLSLCEDIRAYAAPDCLLLNYSNPMAMNVWACLDYGKVPTVGLCHGVQGGGYFIAAVLDVPEPELSYICAGINHQTWYIRILHKGEDVMDRFRERALALDWTQREDPVRMDVLKRFGYFSTESNGHLSEYLPWYRKRAEEIPQWVDMSSWIRGETGGYLRICRESRNWFEVDFPNWLKEPPKQYTPENRSHEHGSYIIEGIETGRTYRGHFNVRNRGILTNLPDDSIVEAPGYVDRQGINMPVVGDLPLGCAAICQASISVQRMAVKAAATGDVTLLKQALMMDPLTSACCNPAEIWQMADEMLVALSPWMPQYEKAIPAAKQRLAESTGVKTNPGYRGAARKEEKSVEAMQAGAQKQREMAQASDKGNLKA